MTATIPVAPEREYGPISRTDIVRYQGASGDFNPIHHDDEVARSVGYPMAFAPGMLQAGMLASYATDWLGVRNIRSFRVRFHAQVWPGDILRFSGSVADIDADGITASLECRNTAGDIVVSGTARFVIAEREEDR